MKFIGRVGRFWARNDRGSGDKGDFAFCIEGGFSLPEALKRASSDLERRLRLLRLG